MISIKQSGRYYLIETKNEVKILYLDGAAYAWIVAKNIGEILVLSEQPQSLGKALSMGDYILYDVKKEPRLTDLQHLELEFDIGKWQGYLLLTGLPSTRRRMTRIIPTDQVITGNPTFSDTQIITTKPRSKTSGANHQREGVYAR